MFSVSLRRDTSGKAQNVFGITFVILVSEGKRMAKSVDCRINWSTNHKFTTY